MNWQDIGIVLNTRKFNDNSMIMKVLTEENGIYSGLVRVQKNKGGFGVNLTGNKLNLSWRARLSEHLGFFNTELNKSRANLIMNNPLYLAGINLICSHLDLYPEREPCNLIYNEFDTLIENFSNNNNWIKEIVIFEFNYLDHLGYGIDLTECALSGKRDSLEWVSPKSGRAVNSEAGKKWSKKLLKLPKFLLKNETIIKNNDEIIDGLNLTGYFLNKLVYSDLNKNLPSSRKKIIDFLKP
jgi:DNA repair protein RecO (recombination protein O)|tara:strand:+ start:9736 stop:10455 length:720 start_codon:yes stop_codon:yes gene_type:complete